jgi:hypothetical protein
MQICGLGSQGPASLLSVLTSVAVQFCYLYSDMNKAIRRFGGTLRIRLQESLISEYVGRQREYSEPRVRTWTSTKLKNTVFWYVTPCGCCKNERFIASIIRIKRISVLGTLVATSV